MRDTEVAVRDPAKDHGCNGCQEAHHCGLDLRRDVVTRRALGAASFSAEATEYLTRPFPGPQQPQEAGWAGLSSPPKLE